MGIDTRLFSIANGLVNIAYFSCVNNQADERTGGPVYAIGQRCLNVGIDGLRVKGRLYTHFIPPRAIKPLMQADIELDSENIKHLHQLFERVALKKSVFFSCSAEEELTTFIEIAKLLAEIKDNAAKRLLLQKMIFHVKEYLLRNELTDALTKRLVSSTFFDQLQVLIQKEMKETLSKDNSETISMNLRSNYEQVKSLYLSVLSNDSLRDHFRETVLLPFCINAVQHSLVNREPQLYLAELWAEADFTAESDLDRVKWPRVLYGESVEKTDFREAIFEALINKNHEIAKMSPFDLPSWVSIVDYVIAVWTCKQD